MDPSDQNEYRPVVETSIKSSDELIAKNPALADASKIESAMKDNLTQKHGILASNIQVREITLQVKDSNGEWKPATKENFPSKGIKITMPYPAGTRKTGFDFFGQHLFTTTMNGFEAGSLENLDISKGDNGISFVVHGLSPVSVGWRSAATAPANQQTARTAPKTGDGSSASLYVVLLMLAVVVGSVSARRLRFAER